VKGETMPPARNHRIAVSSAGFRPVFSTRILFRKRFALFGMQLVSHAHLSSENRFALFGMQFVSTRILFRKPLRTFRDAR
jgi:fructose-1,6-bisphosphatase